MVLPGQTSAFFGMVELKLAVSLSLLFLAELLESVTDINSLAGDQTAHRDVGVCVGELNVRT